MSGEAGAVVVLGAGGHARVVIAIAQRLGVPIVAVLDDAPAPPDERIGGHAVSGTLEALPRLRDAGVTHALVAIGHNRKRAAAAERARTAGLTVRGLRHPTAVVEPGAEVADDAVLCAGAIVGASARIGSNVLLNTGAVVDHESVIGDHGHVGPRAAVAGRVRIGVGTFIGIGATVIDQVRIGAGVLVGAGAAVVDDLPDGVVALGVPARINPALRSPWFDIA